MASRDHSAYSTRQRLIVITFPDVEMARAFDDISSTELGEELLDTIKWILGIDDHGSIEYS